MTLEPPRCTCPTAGWCARHHRLKTVLQHHLCQTLPERFAQWEADREQATLTAPLPSDQEPGLLKKVWNFSQALVRHAADGGRQVAHETLKARLDICRSCEWCDVPRMVCREHSCGCRLYVKAQWSSEVCPQGKWPTFQGEAEEPSELGESS